MTLRQFFGQDRELVRGSFADRWLDFLQRVSPRLYELWFTDLAENLWFFMVGILLGAFCYGLMIQVHMEYDLRRQRRVLESAETIAGSGDGI